jgi:hypothetical protein
MAHKRFVLPVQALGAGSAALNPETLEIGTDCENIGPTKIEDQHNASAKVFVILLANERQAT